jgi:hypothetical protein
MPHETSARPAGYSGTPLAKKLGIKARHRVYAIAAPANYAALLEPLPESVVLAPKLDRSTDIVHVFATERAVLATTLAALRKQLDAEATVWVSWPKKSAKARTDITEDTIRGLALPLGWVDVKVCAVDDTWSGLKLVVRKVLR